MESTGSRNRIQVSHTTAAEIEKLGKGHWLTKREDVVIAKGKGVMETYWLTPAAQEDSPVGVSPPMNKAVTMDKQNRLIDWCVEVLLDKLRQIQALRQGLFLAQTSSYDALVYKPQEGKTCMDEVQEVMELPPYNPKAASILASMNHQEIEIDQEVEDQLRQFVSILAQAYRSNSFHNFEVCNESFYH